MRCYPESNVLDFSARKIQVHTDVAEKAPNLDKFKLTWLKFITMAASHLAQGRNEVDFYKSGAIVTI